MRPLIGAFASAPDRRQEAVLGRVDLAPGGTPQAAPIASSQAAVPSWPTGAEPTTGGRPPRTRGR
jgi:hypothetical protein